MESSSVDDCYFYYYSSCTKGSDCPFRHCEAALGTETVCTLWREGVCYRSNCKFRHMESRINRSSIPCYWENQPGGCRKPHCVFYHHKNRSRMNVFNESGGLILPIASQPVSPAKNLDNSAENKWEPSETLSLSPSSHPIQPVVVSLDGEESDAESTASTPMKVIPTLEKRIFSPSKTIDPATNGSSSEIDLGIKTLEQIKMAKIHRESEHFYNPDKMDMSNADTSSECARLETMHNEPNSYYSQAEYSIPASGVTPTDIENESYQNASLYPTEGNNILHGGPKSLEPALGDLRNILKKKRYVPEKEKLTKELSTKRIISLKKSPGTVEDESPPALTVTVGKENEIDRKGNIGFRVKTLDEIRKEKEKRQSDKIAPSSIGAEVPMEEDDVNKFIVKLLDQVKEHPMENKAKSKGSKRKLRRKPLELYRSQEKQTSDIKKESLEQDSSQMSEDITSTDEAAVKDGFVEVFAGIKGREENKSNNSLKRASLDVPVTSKVRKSTEMHRIPNQKSATSVLDGEKYLRPTEANQKIDDNSLKFKRRNIIRKKNISEHPISPTHVISEDSSSQLQNSDLPKELASQTPEFSVSSSQNSTNFSSDDCSTELKDVEMSNEEEIANSLTSSPSVPVHRGQRLSTLSTVDELDTLFLGSEADICLDEVDANPDTKAEDLFLEFEQMLQS